MDDRDGTIWLDGEQVPWREARIHVLTHTLHYGMGVFEGVRAYKTDRGTAIFRLEDHTKRLGLHAENLNVHTMIAAWSWGSYLGKEAVERGIRVKTSSFTRHHVNISMCKAKANGNYMNSMLALQEALDCGYDEALLLDNEGFVAEGSGENIFLVRDNVLYTPELTSALEGITRETIIALARENGLEVREGRLTRDEVYIADEVFFTGTAAEVTPVRELDGRSIGNGSIGEVTAKLQSLYFDLVNGRLPQHADWLTHV